MIAEPFDELVDEVIGLVISLQLGLNEVFTEHGHGQRIPETVGAGFDAHRQRVAVRRDRQHALRNRDGRDGRRFEKRFGVVRHVEKTEDKARIDGVSQIQQTARRELAIFERDQQRPHVRVVRVIAEMCARALFDARHVGPEAAREDLVATSVRGLYDFRFHIVFPFR